MLTGLVIPVESAGRKRRTAFTAAVSLVIASLLTFSTQPAAALPGQPQRLGPTPPTSTATSQPGDGSSYRVTLLTGDVVTYRTAAGQTSTTVDATTRSGPPPVFATSSTPEGYYVVPSDAQPYIAAGKVDRELFNVRALIAQGLTDDASPTMPVLVRYGDAPQAPTLERRARALPSTTRERTLPAAESIAVSVQRTEAQGFWRSLTGTQQPGAGQPVLTESASKVSLDRRFKASSIASSTGTQQIGAPTAWAAGLTGTGVKIAVLDTGIDTTHPDLAGRVGESANFTGDPDAVDHFGHGTHVASIIAGSGAASGTTYRGVAGGAQLLNGKVLDNSGYGSESAVMAGMEWAVRQGARVVNMSLGATTTDGNDPISQLVDTLSARSGALFVAAAGNDGAAVHVEAPAAASAALAVGAVDSTDRPAPFTSSGPRLGDAGAKPEIVAPGVDIIAARAAGTSMGDPVDTNYTKLSGTSMATPFVAGAAALIAQQHPDWQGPQIKSLLVSSAKDVGAPWYTQGSGRVDLTSALRSKVVATAAVSLGRQSPSGSPKTQAQQVSYTNLTGEPLSLKVTIGLTDWSGRPAPAGTVAVSTEILTVPANGSASVTLTANPVKAASGPYGGTLSAAMPNGDPMSRTVVGLYVEPATYPVKVTLTDSLGAPATPATGQVSLVDEGYDWSNPKANDPFRSPMIAVSLTDGSGTVQMPKGTYSVLTSVMEQGISARRVDLFATAGTVVDRPSTIALDARSTVAMEVNTQHPSDLRERYVSVLRTLPGQTLPLGNGFLSPPGWKVYVSPARAAAKGLISTQDRLTLSEPVIGFSTPGLHPIYDPFAAPKLANAKQLPLVAVGSGQQADFAATDVRGKVAVVGLPVPDKSPSAVWQAAQQVAALAAQNGAAAVLSYVDMPDAVPLVGLTSAPLPQLSLNGEEGRRLTSLVRTSRGSISLQAKASPTYMDNLFLQDRNGIPGSHVSQVDRNRLAEIKTAYHGDRPDLILKKQWFAFPIDVPSSMALAGTLVQGPSALTEYVGPVDANTYWKRGVTEFAPDAAGAPDRMTGVSQISDDVYDRAGPKPVEDWFEAPVRTGAAETSAQRAPNSTKLCSLCLSDTGTFAPALQLMDSTRGHSVDPWQSGQYPTAVRMFRDGKQIPATSAWPLPVPMFTLPDTNSVYRLESEDVIPAKPVFGWPSAAVQRTATKMTSSWTFRPIVPSGPLPSGYRCLDGWNRCAYQPLLQVHYDLGLDLNNRAPAGRDHSFEITTRYHEAVATRAQITALQVWYSTDDGAKWQPATVSAGHAGSYQVRVHNPAASSGTGFVSLRVEAATADGGRLIQTVQRAYGLTG
ncbi:hypothetical protein KALB_3623 [Kutzneria albida DSM 43870]|uniref:Peptidase S8/S53 domain-containing protein n=1 Tax=Kutzneria albida DSM 43870 TaxID=1449976 RepID=W5W7S2_9PSEU|nr:hypothetical protein KALB_3623 [Kutzneria albida DSM 43870]